MRRCGDAGPGSGPGSSKVPAKGCEVPPAARDVSPQLPKSAGKGQSRSYPGLFLQEKKKGGYGKRYMPRVRALFLVIDRLYSSSGAFS